MLNPNHFGKFLFMNHNAAMHLATQAITHLLEHPDNLHQFLNISGLEPNALIAEPLDPDTAHGALAFLAQEEALAEAFCTARRLKPGALLHALHLLEKGGR